MTLAQIAIITKNIINATIALIVISIIGFIGYRIWYASYVASLPPVEEKPTTQFGILPLPKLPEASASSSNYSYSLDTTTGGFPKIDKIVKVYFLPKPYASLLAGEKSQNLANNFEIKSSPQILSETKYQYQDGTKSLTVDLDSANFTYTNTATPSAQTVLDNDEKLVADFKNLLTVKGLLKDELKNGPAKVSLLKIVNGQAVPAQSRDEAQAALISLWPQDIDQKQIVTPDFNKALVNATIVASASQLDNYLSINFMFWPVDTATFATYPIKLPDKAFEDLKSGKGIVIIQPSKPQVSISSVRLVYFEPTDYTSYLQPLYLFEGPGFASLVPAIIDQYLSINSGKL